MHELLHVDMVGPDEFRGLCSEGSPGRAFGGHIAAQALAAVQRTIREGRSVHSLHGYFLTRGRPDREVRYVVQRLRDGNSYDLRGVTAWQESDAIFTMTASFKLPETDSSRHTLMPDVPAPELLDEIGSGSDRTWANLDRTSPVGRAVEIRPIRAESHQAREPGESRRSLWIRFAENLRSSPADHDCALTFLSDLALARTAVIGHSPSTAQDPSTVFSTSLDHTIWFHRPCQADQWMLYTQRSRVSGDGRGHTFGEIWSRQGELIATTTQEVVLRSLRETTPVPAGAGRSQPIRQP
ncbi:acyl-CoA thioesterase [Rhodococcus sp. NPDC127530]|uniref:acyl-CoA thioesterase n=1 Tax=unclassified Rhodococcus (in: high G+C Gram-positive bacteria) TaxID=192944 RepID=UPI00362F645E